MRYVPLAVALLELGMPLPVDVWDASGKLLLRKGQPILSEQDRERLREHQACLTESDASAWQKSFERKVHALRQQGVAQDLIALARLPSDIAEEDYAPAAEIGGGWLDLQEILRGLFYQGEAASRPVSRLDGIEQRALALLRHDSDEGLFILFQALADVALGYCATHALLSAVVCELTACKLDLPQPQRRRLFRAALVMNIGMARAQDSLAQQGSTLNDAQKRLIREHPEKGRELLQRMGVQDEDLLDLVRWHHELDPVSGLAGNLELRRLLCMADSLVAKMAPRKTRLAMSPLGAARSVLLGAAAETAALGTAMAAVLGFYPPGTYVQLINGEKAVALTRGRRANNPAVVSLVSPGGLPLSHYLYRDTADPQFTIRAPVNAEKIRVKVSLEKLRKMRLAGVA